MAPMKPSPPLHYDRLTYRRGFIITARFSHDGVIYGAAWEDQPVRIFSSSGLSPESREIQAGNADVLAVSPTGELAISIGRSYLGGFVTSGTIARMPIGGAPRVICQNGQDADWSRDGKTLLVLRPQGGMHRIEMPLGHVIYETPLWASHPRISPNGELIAFLEHPIWGDDGGSIVIVDLQGKVRVRSETSWTTTGGLAWHPKGEEVWIAGAKRGADRDLYALTLSGKERRVLAFPGRVTLHDVDAKRGVLISSDSGRREAIAARRGEAERNLSWFDWSWLAGLTSDGREILIEEQGAAAHGTNSIYLRPIDGSPAVKMAEGRARGMPLSPDGEWILSLNNDNRLELLSIAGGETRLVPCPDLDTLLWWQMFPDCRRILLLGNRANEPMRLYELALDGDGTAREISPESVNWPMVLSNDGRTVAASGLDGIIRLFPIDGGEPRVVPACTDEDVPIQWATGDGALFVYRRGRITAPIDRIDLQSGERTNWINVHPPDPAGVLDLMPMRITPDGETYAYGYRRFLSDLYLVTGLI
jgi:WD40 repeat protein